MKWVWLLCIISYIVNIVVVIVCGANLVNNIVAWVICTMLAVTLLLKVKTDKLDEEMFISLAKVNTLLRLHLIKDKVKSNNEEATKIIYEEIERLEKEL